MSRATPTGDASGAAVSRDSAVAVISAYGAFRLLIILLALWTFLEGFALVTGGLHALSLGGHDRTAERIIGAQMIVVVPVYVLIAWQRDRYRLLIWVPYGAQLAIILPTGWALLHADRDGALLFVVSLIFFVLLFYFWWHSHPLDFFQPADEDEMSLQSGEEPADEDDEPDDDPADRGDRPRRYRRMPPGH
ncbi:MAG: hypothetical protein M3P30_13770 [Chloroflexota bacterium]|nr:hypothetical protein [Chloroflexota bacterium]